MGPEFTISVQPSASVPASTESEVIVATSGGTDWVQIFHGTDLGTAHWIREHGVDQTRMTAYYNASYAFCTTTCLRTAKQYSTLNNAVMMDGAIAAIFGAKIPIGVIKDLLNNNLVIEVAEDKAYEFRPPSFTTINSVMIDRTVTVSSEITFVG